MKISFLLVFSPLRYRSQVFSALKNLIRISYRSFFLHLNTCLQITLILVLVKSRGELGVFLVLLFEDQ
jgi:hypothetical protein